LLGVQVAVGPWLAVAGSEGHDGSAMAIVADKVLNELFAADVEIDPEGIESKIQFEIRNGYEVEPP
jgi:hypothetical protein